MNGQNRHILSIGDAYLSFPYGISVFENYIYWTDWNYRSVGRSDKWTGQNVQILKNNLPLIPYDIIVVHPLRDASGKAAAIIPNVTLNAD
jgi:hypothetical protein